MEGAMAEQVKKTVGLGGVDRIEVRDINVPASYVDLIVESRLSNAGIVHLSLGATVMDGDSVAHTVEAVVTHRLRMTQRTAQAIAAQLNKLAPSAETLKGKRN
jgi:hypothetical protein